MEANIGRNIPEPSPTPLRDKFGLPNTLPNFVPVEPEPEHVSSLLDKPPAVTFEPSSVNVQSFPHYFATPPSMLLEGLTDESLRVDEGTLEITVFKSESDPNETQPILRTLKTDLKSDDTQPIPVELYRRRLFGDSRIGEESPVMPEAKRISTVDYLTLHLATEFDATHGMREIRRGKRKGQFTLTKEAKAQLRGIVANARLLPGATAAEVRDAISQLLAPVTTGIRQGLSEADRLERRLVETTSTIREIQEHIQEEDNMEQVRQRMLDLDKEYIEKRISERELENRSFAQRVLHAKQKALRSILGTAKLQVSGQVLPRFQPKTSSM